MCGGVGVVFCAVNRPEEVSKPLRMLVHCLSQGFHIAHFQGIPMRFVPVVFVVDIPVFLSAISLYSIVIFTLQVHGDPTHGPPNGQSNPLVVRCFENIQHKQASSHAFS